MIKILGILMNTPFFKVLSNQGDSGVTPETLSQVKYQLKHFYYNKKLRQARVFVIPGPREKFSETEINHMKKYLEVNPQFVFDHQPPKNIFFGDNTL